MADRGVQLSTLLIDGTLFPAYCTALCQAEPVACDHGSSKAAHYMFFLDEWRGDLAPPLPIFSSRRPYRGCQS